MRKTRRLVWIGVGVLLLLYVLNYARLRRAHVFVHDACYYTSNSRYVPLDRVRLGDVPLSFTDAAEREIRYYLLLEKVYLPLRWSEAACWRGYHYLRRR
jgi:hypothetical protein